MKHQQNSFQDPVYVVDGLRTPQLKAAADPGPFSASDMAVLAARQLLLKMPFSAHDIDEVIIGCVMPDASEANIARQIALRIGCSEQTPAWTVQRNCASGLQAIDSGMNSIRTGRSELVMVGGTEVMSRAPLLWNDAMRNWLSKWFNISSKGSKRKGLKRIQQYSTQALRLRAQFFKPVFSLLKGLKDPIAGLSMGQTAEILASRFNITRAEMDQYALLSHQRLSQAISDGLLEHEVTPVYDHNNHYFEQDTGVRKDSNLEKLAHLKPVFDRHYGAVTAGNSAQISDGSSILILASDKAVHKYHLPVLGKLIDCHWEGVSPEEMGLGPAHAIPPLLFKYNLKLSDIDYWEINEAFSAQVLACKKALNDDEFCRQELGLEKKLGDIPIQRLNVNGGGISLGHPVGTSGSRIVLHLLKLLKQQTSHSPEQSFRGIASLCIGGGQGGAILVEI